MAESAPGRPDLDKDRQHQLLNEARQAAIDRDAAGMLRALAESRFLDGLTRRLQARVAADSSSPRPSPSESVDLDVDQAVADATDAFYEHLVKGGSVHNVASYLFKTAQNKLTDIQRRRQREGSGREIETAIDGHGSALDELLDQAEPQPDHDERRRRAFQLVRSLLPRLGQVKVQQVMTVILNAAENHVVDLPDSAIAETLGIPVADAKKSRQRGFQRLGRIAQEEGLGTLILESLADGSVDE